MRSALLIPALVSLAVAAPRPQDIDFPVIDSAIAPALLGPPVAAVSEPITYDESAAAVSASASVISDLSSPTAAPAKRSVDVNAACSQQPDGYGPKPAIDTDDAFLSFGAFSKIARGVPVPYGYTLSFSDLKGSSNANSYLGLTTLNSYDTVKCQELCDAADLCTAFNIYFERDPTIAPGATCSNPPSFTNIKCTLWGSGVTPESATNVGQYRDEFHVVIAGSNGYTKMNPPNPIPSFDGPTEFGGAINAPLNSAGKNTYMGVKYFPGPYNALLCAAACQANTAYNKRHPRSDGTYDACNFFNAYYLSIDYVPDGTYCSLYTQTWGKNYATNYGQYRGMKHYTVSTSYGFSLNPHDSGTTIPVVTTSPPK